MNSSLEKTKTPNLRATYSNFFLIPIPIIGLDQICNAQRPRPHRIHWRIGSEAKNSTILSDQRVESCTNLCGRGTPPPPMSTIQPGFLSFQAEKGFHPGERAAYPWGQKTWLDCGPWGLGFWRGCFRRRGRTDASGQQQN